MRVSEELSSVETKYCTRSSYKTVIVSEELSSVETGYRYNQNKAYNGFQKNLVVWKLKNASPVSASSSKFQKNLVVWKPNSTDDEEEVIRCFRRT